tara:strand:- start:583 stop:1161 length:579 start_codon:yes stop_codon:yes gene_type:complete
MTIRNTETHYGRMAIWVHWIMALLIVGLWLAGDYMHGLPATTPEERDYKFGIYALHKSLGIIALLFILFRMYWRLSNPVPRLPESMRVWEKYLAHGVHLLLYVLMLAMPLSGWFMSTTYNGQPVDVFGLFQMPVLLGKDHEMHEFFEELHEISAKLLLLAFVLHVFAALYHHFIKKDNVLIRMSPRGEKVGP